MRIFMILFIILAFVCPSVYGQSEKQTAPGATAPIDKEQLLERLAALKPFQSEKGGPGLGYALFASKEEFKESLLFIPRDKADAVMKDFGMAVMFVFKERDKDNTQFLILTQWQDNEAAKRFMAIAGELWRLKDKEYKQYITAVDYEELDIAADEKAQVTRKMIAPVGQQKQALTTFISARKDYFFECTLLGSIPGNEVKKLIVQLWKIIEPFTRKGSR
jgi:hypothetical protein